jgi:hypothetical protein
MSQLLTPASLDDLMKDVSSSSPQRRSSEFTKTQKNYSRGSSSASAINQHSSSAMSSGNSKITDVLKSIQQMDDEDASSHLGDFNPPPMASSVGVERTINRVKPGKEQMSVVGLTSGSASSPSYDLNNLKYNYKTKQSVDSYYKQFVPNYSPTSTQMLGEASPEEYGFPRDGVRPREGMATIYDSSDSALMQKLNYMIHLLEESRDIKTNTAMEEIILYCFLGIFIIFIVDSFSRIGKYVR